MTPVAERPGTDSLINRIAAGLPPAAGRIRWVSLGATESMELAELAEQAGRLAARLHELGVGPGDRIGILAANSPAWVLLDLAALRLGAVTAGLEPHKFRAPDELCARYGLTLLFTDQPSDHPAVRSMAEVARLVEKGGPQPGLPVAHYPPDAPTTLKFTSGSSGRPKALAATAGSIDLSLGAVQQLFGHGPGDDLFVFLPLSLLQQRYWVYSALLFGHDITVSTYEAAFPALARVQPTVVMGVPGFYETARAHIEAQAAHDGTSADEPGDRLRDAARRLFGNRIRYLWTGSAPAAPATLDFFTSLGMPLFEGYGLNETCIVSKNHPGAHRPGSVGQVLPGKEVLFDEQGVISVRSAQPVARRYEYAAPGDSERTFGPDGTVRTGDVGYLDQDGFLFVQGRHDDVIVLDNGRKVMVRPIEEFLRADPAVEQCVLFCVDQTRLVVVVAPATDPADEQAVAERVALANRTFDHDERISRFIVAPEGFSIGNGLLTSQFKPRRSRIREAFRQQIDDPDGGAHAR
ncbi:AMP-binding protein [Streptacidiphilus griseoplanus]|uniref:AMP-binding protein n=1 Tax=Peterkaempfera griseoplana TaxID=66896 RepID=UPI000AD04658|nr:AMP-binding protein [Peterkaempfera griseoplana]